MIRRLMDWAVPDVAFLNFAYVPGCRCWRCTPLRINAPVAEPTGAAA